MERELMPLGVCIGGEVTGPTRVFVSALFCDSSFNSDSREATFSTRALVLFCSELLCLETWDISAFRFAMSQIEVIAHLTH